MFSYRHAFHAGNHADVLKHMVLIATLRHLLQKEAALLVLDTHAGAGLYRLDGDYASTSAESADGIARLLASSEPLPALLQDYADTVRAFNRSQGPVRVYPRFAAFTAPRRPRHPLLRIALGVVGLAMLVALLFLGVFVGLAMLAGGMLWRLWVQRGARAGVRRREPAFDGSYRVVGKAQLPLAH